jgi:hypothetical protein
VLRFYDNVSAIVLAVFYFIQNIVIPTFAIFLSQEPVIQICLALFLCLNI